MGWLLGSGEMDEKPAYRKLGPGGRRASYGFRKATFNCTTSSIRSRDDPPGVFCQASPNTVWGPGARSLVGRAVLDCKHPGTRIRHRCLSQPVMHKEPLSRGGIRLSFLARHPTGFGSISESIALTLDCSEMKSTPGPSL